MRLYLAFLLAILLSGCGANKAAIKAAIWLNNGISEDICEKTPPLWDYGFYRRLNSGQLEFLPFCDPQSAHWLAIYDQDLEKILDETLPQKYAIRVKEELRHLREIALATLKESGR